MLLLHRANWRNLVVVAATPQGTAATTITTTTTSPRMIDYVATGNVYTGQGKSWFWVTKNLTATHNKYSKYFIRG